MIKIGPQRSLSASIAAMLILSLLATTGCKRDEPKEGAGDEGATTSTTSAEPGDPDTGTSPAEQTWERTPATDRKAQDLLRYVEGAPATVVWVDRDGLMEPDGRRDEEAVSSSDAFLSSALRLAQQMESDELPGQILEHIDTARLHEAVLVRNSDESWAILVNRAALQETGGTSLQLFVPPAGAGVEGVGVLGVGQLFDELVSSLSDGGEQDGWAADFASSYELSVEELAVGFRHLPESSPTDDGPSSERAWEKAGLNELAGGMAADASIQLAFRSDDTDAVLKRIEFARVSSIENTVMGAPDLPEFLHEWGAYTRMISEGIWSRLTIEADEEGATLRVPAPACGGALQNLIATLGMFGAFYDSLEQEVPPDTQRYQQRSAPIDGECVSLVDANARLPREATRVANEGSHFSVLVLADYGAVLRVGLPSAFGLLPFALEEEAILSAFEESAEGVGFTAPERARIAAYFEKEFAETPAKVFIAAPPEAAELLPGRIAATLQEDERLGHVASSPQLRARYLAREHGGATWERAVARVPQGSVAVIVIPELVFEAFAQQFEMDAATEQWVRTIQSGAIVIDADLKLSVILEFDGREPQETNIARTRAAVEAWGTSDDTDAPADARVEALNGVLELIRSQVVVEPGEDQVVHMSFGPYGQVATGAIATVAIYTAMVRMQVIEGGWPAPEVELNIGSMQRR